MPTEETNELINAKEAADISSQKIINSFMKDVNKAIRSASKDGAYEVSVDNYGTDRTLIKTKPLANSVELLLTSAGYKVNSVLDEDFGCYRFYIDWTPEETATPVFPTDEEWEEARKRFSVAQDDARKIHPVGKQRDPFADYDRERFVRELKDANMLLSGWLEEETKLRNQIVALMNQVNWYKDCQIPGRLDVAILKDGKTVIGVPNKDGSFDIKYVIIRRCRHVEACKFTAREISMRLLGFLCIMAIILEMVVIWPPFVIVYALLCIIGICCC